jgi:HD-GYP domain-containing protein (c-di-GMP phosphodiesterase class II)
VILEQVTSQLKVDAARVLLLNSHTQMLERAARRGFMRGTNPLAVTGMRLGAGIAGRAALERRPVFLPDLDTLLDADMPGLAGERFRAYFAVPLLAKGQVHGVLEVFHRSPMSPDAEWKGFLEALAGQAAIAIDNGRLFEDLQRSNTELSLAYDTTLEGWSHALDLRDKETEGHTQRVTEMTVRLARAMGISESEMVAVRRGALLHDIGKMGIPDSILLKPGPLSDAEWEIMRLHPEYAYELLSPIEFLRPALHIPYCHHEKWDGTGYPRGLKGEQIPLPARIFAIVDVYDALRSDRPYRRAWPKAKVLEHIVSLSGTHFEPRVVEAFIRMEMSVLETVPLTGWLLSPEEYEGAMTDRLRTTSLHTGRLA